MSTTTVGCGWWPDLDFILEILDHVEHCHRVHLRHQSLLLQRTQGENQKKANWSNATLTKSSIVSSKTKKKTEIKMSNNQTRSQASKRGTKCKDTDVAENPEITSLLFGRPSLLLPRPRAWLTKNVKNNIGILSEGDLLHLGQGDPQPLLRVLPVHGCWLSKSPEKPALSLQFLS